MIRIFEKRKYIEYPSSLDFVLSLEEVKFKKKRFSSS